MSMRSFIAIAILAATLAVSSMPAHAQAVQYTAALNGGDEVPATDSKGTGSVIATYDPATKELKWRIEYSGLTGDVTGAHFHGPAAKGTNAPPIVPLSAPFKSPIEGKATLTDEQAKAFADGKVYFNLHTEKNKGGEVRGQMMQLL